MLTPDPASLNSEPAEPNQTQGSDPPPAAYEAAVAPVTPAAPAAPRRGSSISGIQVALGVVALLAGAALFLSGYSLGRQAESTPGTPATEQQAFVPFWDAYRAITQQYAGGTVDRKLVIEGAIRGMIDSLGDPYSSYLSSEEYRKSLQGLSGQFEGIGANIGARNSDGSGASCTPLGPTCQMVVISVIDGSPADKAGIKPADVIVKIDGVSVDGATVDDSVAKVRGAKGTTVVLSLLRKGAAVPDVPIVRDVISAQEVVSRSLANDSVGYIKMSGFSDNSANDLVRYLKDDIAAGQRKIILDLRGNPGGFVTAARKVASQFVGSGPIYWQEDSQGHQVPTNAEPDGVATDTGDPGRGPRRQGQRLCQRDRGRCAPGHEAGDAGRPGLVREGHHPGMAAAPRRHGRVQADDCQMAHARQALDPPHGADARRGGRGPGEHAARPGSGARQGARGPRRRRRPSSFSRRRRSRDRRADLHTAALALRGPRCWGTVPPNERR